MNSSIVFMFSGQGTQYYGMAKTIYSGHVVFRETVDRLDSYAADIVGESVIDKLYGNRINNTEEFNRTLFTHPAIFIVEYALAHTLIAEGILPSFTFGVSLGEFASAAVAGVLSAEDALEGVIEQAAGIEEHCQGGGMLAILDDPDLYGKTSTLHLNTELASINYDSHFVVAGSRENLKKVVRFLEERKILFKPLPVSHAFHSSLIDPASKSFTEYISSKKISSPKLPFVSGVGGGIVDTAGDDYFWRAVRRPMLFREAMRELESGGDRVYVDLGGGALANFAGRNFREGSGSESFSVVTPFNQELKNLEILRNKFTEKHFKSRKDMKMKAFVFPGQGSQHKGMGGELFDEFPEITAKADEILGYSIKDLCLNDPRRELGQTQFTQPALYTVNALTYLERLKTGGSTPDYVAGHSLGEYDALFAAGAFDFETGLRLVKKRGELMSLAAGGGMAAVVGMTVEGVEEVLRENNLNTVDIANINAPSQTVLAGPRGEIERIAPYFDGRGMYIPLNVSGAFHSRLMEASGREFEAFIDQFSFSDLTIPVISNVHARPYRNAEVKDNLVKQITSSVKWTETIRYLMGKGEVEFEEVGPGNVLTKLVGTIREEAEPLIVEEGCAEAAPGAVTSPIEGAAGRETEPPRQGPTDGYSLAPSSLGSAEFRKDYNLSLAYLAGAMYRGISSVEMVVKLGKAGMMGFFGAGGLSIDELEGAIRFIRKELSNGEPYGVNLLHDLNDQEREELKVDVFLDCGVRTVEASGYLSMTPALIRYRAHGLKKGPGGTVEVVNRVIAKVSRPEVAESFLSPAPKRLVDKMVAEKRLTEEQARLLCEIPMADDICVEADSGGHTDGGVAYALMPAMLSLRDAMAEKHGYAKRIRVGAAGGIGSPEAAAAAFVLGADFILTGSINQCTVEASINDVSKDLLQQMNVQDTEYAASGDMFELGGKIQVLKRGVFFPARANKLYELYRNYDSIDEIDEKTKTQIQEKYFKCGFDKAYEDAKKFCSPKEIEKAERNPKSKMALIFRWYFRYSSQLTFADNGGSKVDYQIHCGPSLGAFNRWVAGTELESWRNRHVDQIGEKLMDETAKLLSHRFMNLFEKPRLFNRD